MTEELKPCPFCSHLGEKHSNIHGYENSVDYSSMGQDMHFIKCTRCGAEGEKIHRKFFCDFTTLSVQDFRRNPSLRAHWDDLYSDYCVEIEKQVIAAWNTRHGEK